MNQLPKNELHEAYWIYTHRFLLKKIGYALAITTTSVIWIIFIFSFVIYIAGMSSARKAQETLSDSQVLYRNRVVAQPLQVTLSGAVASSTTTFDAYILVKNPNTFYSANFNYSINIDGKLIAFTDGQIMPETEVYYVASAITGTTLPKSTTGIIDQTTWHRIKDASFGQLNFTISDSLVEAVKIGESYPYSKLSATLKNQVIIGFKTIRAVAVVKQNATILGIQELTLHDIASYSETPLEFYWQRRFLANSTSEILVYTDYINRDNLVYPGE